jgi:uncharacterized membrane protein
MFMLSVGWPLLPRSFARTTGFFLSLACHRMETRCLHMAWGVSGLCARCTFFWLGLAMAMILPQPSSGSRLRGALTGLALLLPMMIDGALQYAGLYESTNPIRTATGLLGGAGASMAFRALLSAGSR